MLVSPEVCITFTVTDLRISIIIFFINENILNKTQATRCELRRLMTSLTTALIH